MRARLIAACLIVLTGLSIAACRPNAESYEAQLAAETETDPRARALRDGDPEFYAGMIERAAAQLAAGEDGPTVQAAVAAQVQARIIEVMPHLGAAPIDQLVQTFRDELQLLETLRDIDPEVCGRTAMAQQTDRPPAAAEGVYITAITGRLRAARAGMATPTRHEASTDADMQAVYDAMTDQGPEGAASVERLGPDLLNASPADQCGTTISLMQAVLSQPEDRRGRLVATMLGRFGETTRERLP